MGVTMNVNIIIAFVNVIITHVMCDEWTCLRWQVYTVS